VRVTLRTSIDGLQLLIVVLPENAPQMRFETILRESSDDPWIRDVCIYAMRAVSELSLSFGASFIARTSA